MPLLRPNETTVSHATPRSKGPLSGLFWLLVLAASGLIAAVGLSAWVPHLQRERAVSRIRQLGGTVTTRPVSGDWNDRLLNGLRGEPSRRVVAVDLSAADLTDEDVRILQQFHGIQQLSLSGHRLTDASLRQLDRLRRLRFLMLINCRNIGPQAVAELQRINPGLRVERRGAALLGIYGRAGVLGCQVISVRAGTAAADFGILPGDEITRLGGRRIRLFDTLVEEIARHQPGDEVTVHIHRGGRELELAIRLGGWDGRE